MRTNKQFWRLYEHLRKVHEMDPIILEQAKTMDQLRTIHRTVDKRCTFGR